MNKKSSIEIRAKISQNHNGSYCKNCSTDSTRIRMVILILYKSGSFFSICCGRGASRLKLIRILWDIFWHRREWWTMPKSANKSLFVLLARADVYDSYYLNLYLFMDWRLRYFSRALELIHVCGAVGILTFCIKYLLNWNCWIKYFLTSFEIIHFQNQYSKED